MKNDIIPIVKDFIQKEKINLTISKDNSSEFWLDDVNGSITVRFKLNTEQHEILYDVYSPELATHLKEETIQDVERLEFLAEEQRNWRSAESIENVWLVLDQIKYWAEQNDYFLKEKQMI